MIAGYEYGRRLIAIAAGVMGAMIACDSRSPSEPLLRDAIDTLRTMSTADDLDTEERSQIQSAINGLQNGKIDPDPRVVVARIIDDPTAGSGSLAVRFVSEVFAGGSLTIANGSQPSHLEIGPVQPLAKGDRLVRMALISAKDLEGRTQRKLSALEGKELMIHFGEKKSNGVLIRKQVSR